MAMRHSVRYGTILLPILAAAGFSLVAAAPGVSQGARGLARSAAVSPAGGPATRGRAASPAEAFLSATRIEVAPLPNATVAPPERVDTARLAPGALLDVWLDDEERDLRTITTERSLGTAVAQGDFFRYTSVNADPDLREFWGRPLLLKWSALLDIRQGGAYVFISELSKERGWGALRVRTLVRVNEETVFERQIRVFGGNAIFETESRVLTLAPGYYRLEVWLAVKNSLDLPPGTQLGTFLKIREPGVMTAEPLQPSRVWHRVR